MRNRLHAVAWQPALVPAYYVTQNAPKITFVAKRRSGKSDSWQKARCMSTHVAWFCGPRVPPALFSGAWLQAGSTSSGINGRRKLAQCFFFGRIRMNQARKAQQIENVGDFVAHLGDDQIAFVLAHLAKSRHQKA